MKYEIAEVKNQDPLDPVTAFCLRITWDYKNPERKDDQWHTLVEFKDWLHAQFGLNRGYRYVVFNELFHYVYFRHRDDMMLFKLVF